MDKQPALDQGPSADVSETARRIDAVTWALFFIWLGIALLAEASWGWFLLGTGVLTVTAQFARWQMGLRIEGFWVAGGTVFLASGLWLLLALPWPLAPILLILLGVALLGQTVRFRRT